MNYLTIDYLIVYAFLAITLVIGLRAGRGITDIREYAIANKRFGTGALVLTYLATNITGAGVLHVTNIIFSKGIILVLAGGLGVVIDYLLTAWLVAPKIDHFKNCLTMGDLMQVLYGPRSGIIAGVLGFLTAICIAGMDLLGMSIVCETLLGIKATWCIVVGVLLLAIYSAYGGIKAVTATDVFQFLILLIVFPTIAYIFLNKAGGIQAVFSQLPAAKLKVFSHDDFSLCLTLFILWSIFPAGMIDPAIIQRFLMAKNGQQIRNQYLIVAGFESAFRLVILFIAFSALVIYPELENKSVLPHLIQNLLPVGLKGLAITALLATSISSIDSYLHAAGLTLSHDVIKPLFGHRYSINEVRCARYTTVLVSVVAIAIALRTSNTFGLLLDSLAFTGPLLMFPLLSGIIGLKTDKRSFYVALFTTLVAFIGLKLFAAVPSHLLTLWTIVVNGIVFFGMHIVQNKGIAIVHRGEQEAYYTWRPVAKHTKNFFTKWQFSPQAIIHYSQEQVQKYGAPYILFGIFFSINYIVPYFLWPTQSVQHTGWVVGIRMLGGVLCGLLMIPEKWPKRLLPLMPVFWHFTVLYCLPFTNALMFFLTGASTEWLVNIITIIILLVLLLDWVTALIIGMLGIGIAGLVYWIGIDARNLTLPFTTQYLLIYQIIFGLLIGLLFARRRQHKFDQLATEHQYLSAIHQEDKAALLEIFKEKVRLLKTLQNSGVTELTQVVKLIKTMRKEEASTGQSMENLQHRLQALDEILTPIALALEKVENRATDYLRLDIASIPVSLLLEQLQNQIPNISLSYQLETHHTKLVCDPKRIQKLLADTAEMIQDTAQVDTIYISICHTKLTYPIRSISQDYTKKIAAVGFSITAKPTKIKLEDSYTAQMDKTSWPMPANPYEMVLVNNQRIVKAHYGYTNLNSGQPKDYPFYLYIIPANINDIRPRDMNDPYMELGAELVRANDAYPGAKAQEENFLRAVQEKTKAAMDNIKLALEMIKWYHGPKNRHSGEPFYLHPMAVAQVVLDWNPEEATILGALLHDTVEDTSMLLENIEMIFGSEVMAIVDSVTHFAIAEESFYKLKLSSHENILTLLEVQDNRALYVKLADRLHNLRTIEAHPSIAKRREIAEETLQFYVPMAQALGLEAAGKELKAISLLILSEVVASEKF